jgi:hypothetical protein
MPKINVELDWETVDNIVIQQIIESRDGLIMDLERRKKKNNQGGIFDNDKKKDIILIKTHIDAFELVIKYFGGNIND